MNVDSLSTEALRKELEPCVLTYIECGSCGTKTLLRLAGQAEIIVIRNTDSTARLPMLKTQFCFTGWMTFVKLLNFSVPIFPPQLNGNTNSIDLTGLIQVNTCKMFRTVPGIHSK